MKAAEREAVLGRVADLTCDGRSPVKVTLNLLGDIAITLGVSSSPMLMTASDRRSHFEIGESLSVLPQTQELRIS